MLELKDISYSVSEADGKKDILSHIDLDFPDGTTTVITGHNGSGKSTLVKLIMGMESPSGGSILLDGEDITSLSVTERARRGMTIAFQQPVRFKGITVKDLLDIAVGANCSVGTACNFLSTVGLCAKNYVSRPVDDTLSGGELKRIELAVALAKGGRIFLLDEPEAGIDLWSFDELIKVFASLRDKTVIIVSHQSRILETADRIVVLDSGSAPRVGSRDDILPTISTAAYPCGRE